VTGRVRVGPAGGMAGAERLRSPAARTLDFEPCQHSFMMNTVK